MAVAALLITIFVLMLAVMGVAWVVQRAVRNAGWVDVFWTFGTGAAGVAAALWPAGDPNAQRQFLVAALCAVWSVRLGYYMGMRVRGSADEDARYAALRKIWGARFQRKMLGAAMIQAPASALLVCSIFAATHSSSTPLGLRDVLGAALLAIAIAGEGIADEQMRRFKATAARGAINTEGLWAWSRHPNYFFEWLGWFAYPMIGFDPAKPESWATWIAPALMYLILRYGTGVPILERTMLESRGDAFRAYQAQVSAFIPRPPQRR